MVVGREEVATHKEVEMNAESMEVASSFRFLVSRFIDNGSLQDDVEMRAGKGLKSFRAMKMYNVRNLGVWV